ncbi:polysaccharide pyruvyl transferase family protein [Lutibacter sp. A80]|uniref:polysaccharide pyruvyl transferase family protein n=1 Tax=Lutibacter sp. A80 TaxID=2918453 RepID=UPI001F06429C|nr:polysaccharide pyruvyl transferase family protein [Lutibacter sp. A80]UMB60336.1 polysaccharide pyruvyl transferase family protein [Lutibacter sp. A80]
MKILMFFHSGSTNRGCEAIVRTAAVLIKEKYPKAIIHLASGNPESDKIIPFLDAVFLDKRRSIKKYSIPWFISAFKVKLLNDENYAFRKIYADIIDSIPNYDIFLSIGGDNYCYGEQPGIYEIDRCIKKAGKKLILWGASIGKEDLSEPKIEDLKLFDIVLAREPLTYNLLKEHKIQNVKQVADGAFLLDKEELPLPEGWQEGNTIGFNFSPLVNAKNQKSKEAAFNLVQHIIETTDMAIAFTPHVIQPNNDDYAVLLEFYSQFKDSGRVLILPNNLNATQYKGYIARMRFFIGARTHATIAAYSSLVPTMVLGYSVKSKGIAIDIFGEEKLVLNLNEISNTEILIAKFNELLEEEEQLKVVLKNKIPEIKKMAIKAIDFI